MNLLTNSISDLMKELHIFNYKKNRLQQIKGFYYAARCRSISEAAKLMNLTQSTVSLQIQSLERDLGFKLLKRDSKPITLTPEGEDFYKMACPVMHEFESIFERFLMKSNDNEQKKVEIAVHHVAISYLMPKIVSFFMELNPGTKILIRNISPSEAIKRLKEGKIDLAFYPNPPRDPELRSIDTISYDPVLIMNKNHPLANKRINSLKDLKDFDLIRIDRNLITLPLFEEAVENHGLGGSIEFENGNWEMLKSFVKENNFVAIISEICLDKNDDDLVVKNLGKFFPAMHYRITMKNGKSLKPVAQNMIQAICEITKGGKFLKTQDGIVKNILNKSL